MRRGTCTLWMFVEPLDPWRTGPTPPPGARAWTGRQVQALEPGLRPSDPHLRPDVSARRGASLGPARTAGVYASARQLAQYGRTGTQSIAGYDHGCDSVSRRMAYIRAEPEARCGRIARSSRPKKGGIPPSAVAGAASAPRSIILADQQGRPYAYRDGEPMLRQHQTRAYDNDAFCAWLAQQAIEAVMPARCRHLNPQPHAPNGIRHATPWDGAVVSTYVRYLPSEKDIYIKCNYNNSLSLSGKKPSGHSSIKSPSSSRGNECTRDPCSPLRT